MARRPKLTSGFKKQLNTLSSDDFRVLGRLPTLETDDAEFGEVFRRNPGAALAAKGLEVSPTEIQRIETQLAGLGRAGGNVAATEVEVSVKVKF